MAAIHEAAQKGNSDGGVFSLQLSQGEVWFEISVSVLPEIVGLERRFIFLSRDVTARKQAEIDLRASETRYRTLVEHSPYCIHEIDLSGRLTCMNKAGLKMLGLDDACKIQGMLYLDFVCNNDRERIGALLANAIAGKESEFDFQTPDGTIFQSSFVPIKDNQGNVQSLMGITIDITARKHTEWSMVFWPKPRKCQRRRFFPALARFLAATLQVDFVCIDQFDDDILNATTLTVWHDGKFRDNVSYALGDTPCGVVVKKGKSFYPFNVQQHFPNDLMLQEIQPSVMRGLHSSDTPGSRSA